MNINCIKNILNIFEPYKNYPRTELTLKWEDIFLRLVREKKPGLCYERDELLYQALDFLNFEVYRIEGQAKNEIKRQKF